jgi:2-methylcitrate dehydratase PrpD
MHPTIDGCLRLHAEHHPAPQQIERIDLAVHPLVLELTGKRAPQTGLEAKFSIYFAAAVATVTGAAGMKQFSDEAVRDPVVSALRQRVVATVDPAITAEQVRVVITMNDGRRFEKFIEHAVGSVENPMTDAQLDAKFLDLADGVLPADQAHTLLGLCRRIDELEGAGAVAQAAHG